MSLVHYSEPRILRLPQVVLDIDIFSPVKRELVCPHEILDAISIALTFVNGEAAEERVIFSGIAQQLDHEITAHIEENIKSRIQHRNRMIHEELIKVAWAPHRHVDWCLDETEKTDLHCKSL